MVPVAIEFRQVSKYYAKQAALDNISFSVKSGECFGLVGANGAGKTTLFKALLDLCGIDCGVIKIFNVDHVLPSARKNVAFLPERFMPQYPISGAQFLRYMLRLYKTSFSEEKIHKVLHGVNFDVAQLKKSMRAYSKGMTQKLALAACLSSAKNLYLLDEPASGLDPKARASLRNLLLEHKALGQTILLSSHNLLDVETLCDRMAILDAGKLLFVGTPHECCTHYSADDLEQAYLKAVQ